MKKKSLSFPFLFFLPSWDFIKLRCDGVWDQIKELSNNHEPNKKNIIVIKELGTK
jgi:hypothetical protein